MLKMLRTLTLAYSWAKSKPLYNKNFCLCIYFWERERDRDRDTERERDSSCAQAGGEAEREERKVPSRLHNVSAEPTTGPDPRNCQIITWAEIKSQTLN